MYDAPSYADWVGRYLGPKLRASHPTVKIMAWDYNRLSDAVPFANALVSGGYSRYVDVVAWHWYNMPGNLGLNYVAQVEAIFPGVPQLATEACYLQGLTETWSTGAEQMGLDALADVNWVRVCFAGVVGRVLTVGETDARCGDMFVVGGRHAVWR